MPIKYNHENIVLAKNLRKNATPQENHFRYIIEILLSISKITHSPPLPYLLAVTLCVTKFQANLVDIFADTWYNIIKSRHKGE